MKRLSVWVLVLLFTCALMGSAQAHMPEETTINNDVSYTANEFSMAVTRAMESSLNPEDALRAVKSEYTSALRELTTYTQTELEQIGYSDEAISLITTMKANRTYTPSVNELARASANVDFNLYCTEYDKDSTNMRTDFTFEWDFEWDSCPILKMNDCVGAYWHSSNVSCEEDTISYSVTFSNGTTYTHTNPNAYGMDWGSSFVDQAVWMQFRMSRDDTTAWCESGEGTFSLVANKALNALQLSYGYGHKEFVVGGITIGYKSGCINFGTAYNTLDPGVETFVYPL